MNQVLSKFKFEKSVVLLAAFLTLLNLSISQKIGFGKCPEVEGQKNFVVAKYVNRWWYEYARFTNINEIFTKCAKMQYYYDYSSEYNYKNGLESRITETKFDSIQRFSNEFFYPLGVRIQFERDLFIMRNIRTKEGKVRFESLFSRDGKLYTNFNGKEKLYWILDTDYETYSLVWSCSEFFNIFHLEYFWVFTSSRSPSKETIDKINEKVAERQFISNYNLKLANQKYCNSFS